MSAKTVFLFGAGAVIDWCEEKVDTGSITEHLLKCGPKMPDSETTVFKYIYDLLRDGQGDKNINFEDVLSILQLAQDWDKQLRNGVQSIFLEWFCVENNLEDKLGNNLNEILRGIYNQIIGQINYNISKNRERNKSLNKAFCKWISNEVGEERLRLYTLNYDELFKSICEDELGVNFFDGFTDSFSKDDDRVINPYKFIDLVNENIHFNLHGGINWKYDDKSLSQDDFYPEIKKANHPHQEFVDGNSSSAENSYGIIAGGSKYSRTQGSPFNDFYTTFRRDCLTAEKIIIVGYSFSDDHINECILRRLKYGVFPLVTVIDPCGRVSFDNSTAEKLSNEKWSESMKKVNEIRSGFGDFLCSISIL